MKYVTSFKLLIAVLMVSQFNTISAQTVDEIISQNIATRGGEEKLKSIKSVYLEGIRQPSQGSEMPLKITIVNGQLFRADLEVGVNTGYTIVTPTKGWTYYSLTNDKPQEMPEVQLKTMQEQLDIAGPLIDHAAKGYKVELLEKEVLQELRTYAYKIHITNADGTDITYFIDTKTHLLIKLETNNIELEYSDYKKVNGIMFPYTVVSGGTGGIWTTTFDKIEVNKPVDEKLYKPSN